MTTSVSMHRILELDETSKTSLGPSGGRRHGDPEMGCQFSCPWRSESAVTPFLTIQPPALHKTLGLRGPRGLAAGLQTAPWPDLPTRGGGQRGGEPGEHDGWGYSYFSVLLVQMTVFNLGFRKREGKQR